MSTAAALLVELGQLGVQVWSHGDRLRFRPRSAVDAELRERLAANKAGLLQQLALNSEPAGDLLERFLTDDSIPAAIFRSRALDRDFVLARGEAALEVLTESDRALPAVYFAECPELAKLPLQGLKALLDLREVLGPGVRLAEVRRSPEPRS